MAWLNYHHLLYFWTVVREGGLEAAAKKLRLSHQTISGQVHALEASLGERLLRKQGRRLVLTEVGQIAYDYADEIFRLGNELVDAIQGRPTGRPMRLLVGIADVLPKLIARRLLLPAQQLPQPVRLVCREDKPDRLLAELAIHSLDVILSDSPASSTVSVRAFSHLLGESQVSFFATASLAKAHQARFPKSLDGAPMLLPTENTALRRSLEQWFRAQGIHPRIEGEFEDSALLASFAQEGGGLFAAPSVIAREVEQQYRVKAIGVAQDVRERFYAITVERRLKHPAVIAISESAKSELFDSE
jgi:LysR family transcriptional regulator, transcriptional activator of nhaA